MFLPFVGTMASPQNCERRAKRASKNMPAELESDSAGEPEASEIDNSILDLNTEDQPTSTTNRSISIGRLVSITAHFIFWWFAVCTAFYSTTKVCSLSNRAGFNHFCSLFQDAGTTQTIC